MTSAQVVETSVNVISNSPSQDYTHPDDRTLLYDGKMFCLVCQECPQKSNDSSSFVSTGCSNFKLESLKSHHIQGHIQAQEAIRAKERPLEAPLPRAFLLIDEEVRQKMKKLFDLAHMVAKLELPFTVYPSLCSLEKKHGVLLGNTYLNDKACKNFVRVRTVLKSP